ncbi:MAG: hypothetical protein J7578_13905, partial [Chitinophagaceae bacterium]|nr:hypothetical protein [Chitinophagaceae bacterium]
MHATPSNQITVENRGGVQRFLNMKWYLQWLVFAAIASILYLPVLGNTFLSDDHLVLWKTGVQQELNVDGFFRPLSDITLWLSYRLFKLNSLPYYLFQVLLHALNAVMLMQYCRKISKMRTSSAGTMELMPLLAALIFLTYPFHNEAIAWILGRGALMAGSFAIGAMLALVSHWKPVTKISLIALCYFLGLAAYETIIILPLLVGAQLLIMGASRKEMGKILLVLAATFGLHAGLRIAVSGAFIGGYGAGFFQGASLDTMLVMLKSAGRVLLPPSDNSQWMMIAFASVLLIGAGALYTVWRRTKNDMGARRFLYTQLACLAIAMLVPMWLGVSTRTSESDRFLYLPSIFLSGLMAFTLMHLFSKAKQQVIMVALFLVVQVALLEENNLNWKKASDTVLAMKRYIERQQGEGRLLVLNLPGETDGAYIFRVGFKEFLRLYGYDSEQVKLVSQLTRDQQLALPGRSARIIG